MQGVISYPLLKVKGSAKHGKGIFAKTDIPKGTKILQYVGEKIPKSEADRRIEATEKRFGSKKKDAAYYIFELNKKYDLDGDVEWNLARFVNHACEPNCETETIDNEIWIKALRDIKKGEELSYDYGFGFDKEETLDCPCKCGAKNCAGYIVAKKERKKLEKFLRASV